MKQFTKEIMKSIVDEVKKQHQCNCDLDNWQPIVQTGHTTVCRIHKIAVEKWRNIKE
jgi:hypothetical protein